MLDHLKCDEVATLVWHSVHAVCDGRCTETEAECLRKVLRLDEFEISNALEACAGVAWDFLLYEAFDIPILALACLHEACCRIRVLLDLSTHTASHSRSCDQHWKKGPTHFEHALDGARHPSGASAMWATSRRKSRRRMSRHALAPHLCRTSCAVLAPDRATRRAACQHTPAHRASVVANRGDRRHEPSALQVSSTDDIVATKSDARTLAVACKSAVPAEKSGATAINTCGLRRRLAEGELANPAHATLGIRADGAGMANEQRYRRRQVEAALIPKRTNGRQHTARWKRRALDLLTCDEVASLVRYTAHAQSDGRCIETRAECLRAYWRCERIKIPYEPEAGDGEACDFCRNECVQCRLRARKHARSTTLQCSPL